MRMQINSKEYWNVRFKTDWIKFSGDKQTIFFAEIMCKQLPDYLVDEIKEKKYSICDMGCAEGDSIPIFNEKFGLNVSGMDFSEEAIEKAKRKNPNSNFWVGDLTNLPNSIKYDIIICSNVLEHFEEPWSIVSNLTKVCNEYIMIMVPYKEQLIIDEHCYIFSEENIPLNIDNFILSYVSTIDGKEYANSMYPDQQVLLIYNRKRERNGVLQLLTEGIVNSFLRNEKQKMQIVLDNNKELEVKCNEYERRYNELYNNKELEAKCNEYESRCNEYESRCNEYESRCNEYESKCNEYESRCNKYEASCSEYNIKINTAIDTCNTINNLLWYKIFCVFARTYKQFLRGNKEERKKFCIICKNFIKGRMEFSKNDGYNLILNIRNILENKVFSNNIKCGESQHENIINENVINEGIINENVINEKTKNILKSKYKKQDIIILSVIDYNFRFQRPQHFAKRFAENGHRVFYVNANFIRPDSCNTVEDNLYMVDFAHDQYNAIYMMDGKSTLAWMKEKFDMLISNYAIRDAVVVIDYPNWVFGSEYLREQYGFKLVTDYMDDYTGFLGTTEDFLKNNCIRLLGASDAVVVSSQFLADVANKYADADKIVIVRNGTEVEHFYQAISMQSENRVRKVVGYYGAVSHWFAWEKVCHVAKELPDCDVVIIGEVTDFGDELKKYSNIKLLGEKTYTELPKYLADFDVCLIPFDTSTDLIKATNPVKFYEYLSAGKKIVATEIPELEPFKDEYVYMANDNEKFTEYVRMCLDGTDSLESADKCIAFAKENDWQKRYEAFEEKCRECVPKVSVIVLTYNNLQYNIDCITSILEKTAYANYELIIVDNQSTDGTIEYLKDLETKQIPNVKIIFNTENSGFAGGNNLGIKASTGDYVLLLNNDTIVTRGWMTSLVKHMENDKLYGMCNPVTNSIGNESQIETNYKSKEEMEVFAYNYTLKHMNEEYKDVDRIPLFSTIIRRKMIDEIGLLDTAYKVGMFEDDDYTAAALKAGYKIVIAEDAFVHHVNNGSFKKLDEETYRKIFEENKKIYEQKWNTKWTMPKGRVK